MGNGKDLGFRKEDNPMRFREDGDGDEPQALLPVHIEPTELAENDQVEFLLVSFALVKLTLIYVPEWHLDMGFVVGQSYTYAGSAGKDAGYYIMSPTLGTLCLFTPNYYHKESLTANV